MHVLFNLRTGGLEMQVVNVINHSDRTRFRHSICCLEPEGRELADALRELKPAVHLAEKKTGISLTLPFRLARLFVREKVDVVHAGSFGTYLYLAPAAKLTRTGGVYGEHGDVAILCKRARIRRAMRPLAWCTDQFYSVTDVGREPLAELTGRPVEQIEFVPNGVDVDRFRPGDPAAARNRLGIDPDAFVIGFVGRLDPVKNLGVLFGALPAVHKAVDKLAVVIAGAGPENDKLHEFAAASPVTENVHLLGRRDDVPDLLPAMSVVVLPSFTEANSIALIEAMAAGRPVVASNAGGNPEIVRHGETGFLFELGQPGALAGRLIELARSDELQERFGESARDIAVREYSLEAAVRRHEAMYERAVRRKRA